MRSADLFYTTHLALERGMLSKYFYGSVREGGFGREGLVKTTNNRCDFRPGHEWRVVKRQVNLTNERGREWGRGRWVDRESKHVEKEFFSRRVFALLLLPRSGAFHSLSQREMGCGVGE